MNKPISLPPTPAVSDNSDQVIVCRPTSRRSALREAATLNEAGIPAVAVLGSAYSISRYSLHRWLFCHEVTVAREHVLPAVFVILLWSKKIPVRELSAQPLDVRQEHLAAALCDAAVLGSSWPPSSFLPAALQWTRTMAGLDEANFANALVAGEHRYRGFVRRDSAGASTLGILCLIAGAFNFLVRHDKGNLTWVLLGSGIVFLIFSAVKKNEGSRS